jgi:hypothetical protein
VLLLGLTPIRLARDIRQLFRPSISESRHSQLRNPGPAFALRKLPRDFVPSPPRGDNGRYRKDRSTTGTKGAWRHKRFLAPL